MKLGAAILLFLPAAPLIAGVRAPEAVPQGQFLHVEHDAAEPTQALTASFLKKDTACYPDPKPNSEASQLWHCLIAVPANAPEGPQELELCDNGATIDKR